MKNQFFVLLCLFGSLAGCKKDKPTEDTSYNPVIETSNFSNPMQLTNAWFTFETGKKYVYEGQTTDGFERIEVQLVNTQKTVMGISCAVVNDKVWIDGILVEDTDDWYAQDNAGNVWYMGEDVDNYSASGTIEDHDGSWEAGVDGAKPGIQMLANPQPGMSYRQEYYLNEAEDEAEIEQTGQTVTIPLDTYTDCVVIREWTDLEPGQSGQKTYAPGVGMIKDGAHIVLVKIE